MYFSRLRLNADSRSRGFWPQMNLDYGFHKMVWKLFPCGAEREFLYRLESVGRTSALLYLLSSEPPVDDSGMWTMETKKYAPLLLPGLQLGFCLRANPTVTREGKRHDVVMDLKRRKNRSDEQFEMAEIVQQAGEQWLRKRLLAKGLKLHAVRVDGYQTHKMQRRGRQLAFSTCEFEGLVEVVEPEAASSTLIAGIGRARGFGCGLILVRRVGGST